jgi:hypothetical protein
MKQAHLAKADSSTSEMLRYRGYTSAIMAMVLGPLESIPKRWRIPSYMRPETDGYRPLINMFNHTVQSRSKDPSIMLSSRQNTPSWKAATPI